MSFFYKGQRLTHLRTREFHIWRRFLDKNINRYKNYLYDVALPVKKEIPEGVTGKYKSNAIYLSSKRIDVVMQDDQDTWIVEIRPGAKQTAVGNLMLYYTLYNAKFAPSRKPLLMLVTDLYNPELDLTCKSLNILYIYI